jgi:hypothetical protein
MRKKMRRKMRRTKMRRKKKMKDLVLHKENRWNPSRLHSHSRPNLLRHRGGIGQRVRRQ